MRKKKDPYSSPTRRLVLKEFPYNKNESDLVWLCKSISLYEKIDKEKIAYKMLQLFIFFSHQRKPITINMLQERILVSRGAIINQLNKFLKMGIIKKSGRNYYLRAQTLEDTIKEMEKDYEKVFTKLKDVARKIDLKYANTLEL
jgi:predicted transcriptional regulator